jgi:hypothetical protein
VALLLTSLWLDLRYRGKGRLLGRTSRWWTVAVIVGVGAASAVIGAAAGHAQPTYVGIAASLAVPGALLVGDTARAASKDAGEAPHQTTQVFTLGIAFLLYHLDEAMKNDCYRWCEARIGGDDAWHRLAEDPDLIRKTTTHLYAQMRPRAQADGNGRLKALNKVNKAILLRLEIEQLSRGTVPAEEMRGRLMRGGLYKEDSYDRFLTTQRETLRSRLCSNATSDLNTMLSHAYLWRYSIAGCQAPLTEQPPAKAA